MGRPPSRPKYIVGQYTLLVSKSDGQENQTFYMWSDGVVTWKDSRDG